MGYEAVSAGLHQILSDIEALGLVLDYEPDTVQQTPLVYSVIDGRQEEVEGSVVGVTYRTLHRLVLSYQNPEVAEGLLRSLLDLVPAAIRAQHDLVGVGPGDAWVSRGEPGWVWIGGTWFRSVDFYSEVTTRESLWALGG